MTKIQRIGDVKRAEARLLYALYLINRDILDQAEPLTLTGDRPRRVFLETLYADLNEICRQIEALDHEEISIMSLARIARKRKDPDWIKRFNEVRRQLCGTQP